VGPLPLEGKFEGEVVEGKLFGVNVVLPACSILHIDNLILFELSKGEVI